MSTEQTFNLKIKIRQAIHLNYSAKKALNEEQFLDDCIDIVEAYRKAHPDTKFSQIEKQDGKWKPKWEYPDEPGHG